MRTFKNIATLIKTKRVNHPNNYSQSDISKLLGYKNGQFISNVERGLCNIPLKMLTKVCDILNISKEEIRLALMRDFEETLYAYLSLSPERAEAQEKKEDESAEQRPFLREISA